MRPGQPDRKKHRSQRSHASIVRAVRRTREGSAPTRIRVGTSSAAARQRRQNNSFPAQISRIYSSSGGEATGEVRWSSRWAASTRCVNLLLASNPPCNYLWGSFDLDETRLADTIPPPTRCYSPSPSGRIAMRCLLSLACLKGQARLMVMRP